MKIHFAPMQGYADHIYRRLHNEIYGGVDCYYTPFIRIEKGEPRHQDIQRLEKSIGDGTHLVPQIIFNGPEEFLILSEAVKRLGFNRIDINLGCPYPMQAKKGRGVAVIGNPTMLRHVSALIVADGQAAYSVKMRLGVERPDEWQAIMPILNETPLAHITLHPRIARQMYGGEIYREQFFEFRAASKHTVIWNGDITSLMDIDRLDDEDIDTLMIGRGLLCRPSLAAEYAQGREWDKAERISELMRFHDALLDEYRSTLCGPTQILQHIKPFWEYMTSEIDAKVLKAIRKAVSIDRYLEAVNRI